MNDKPDYSKRQEANRKIEENLARFIKRNYVRNQRGRSLRSFGKLAGVSHQTIASLVKGTHYKNIDRKDKGKDE